MRRACLITKVEKSNLEICLKNLKCSGRVTDLELEIEKNKLELEIYCAARMRRVS